MEPGDRRSILLVEDDVLVRLSIGEDFRQAGFTVVEAANADEAIAVLQTHADAVGVVVTDIQMPGAIDGRGLIRLIRQRYPELRVVVLSGADPAVLSSIAADAVFSKPHEAAALVAQVKRLLERPPPGNGSQNGHAANS